MRVRASGELAYGGGTLAVELEIDASGVVALIGPNLTGKSLLLQCIFQRGSSTIGRPLQAPPDLRRREREIPGDICRRIPRGEPAVRDRTTST
jgi:ABC-type phosphate/phosphonate transport system ATPase subunit